MRRGLALVVLSVLVAPAALTALTVATAPPAGAAAPVTEYPISAVPRSIAVGPDGNMWFTERSASKVARIGVDGTGLTEFPLAAGAGPTGIVAGPDGNLWFTELGSNKIGRIAPNGSGYVEFPEGPNAGADELVVGPDGNIWFPEPSDHAIARMGMNGSLTEFSTGGTMPWQIASNPVDGALWFGYSSLEIGRITTNGSISDPGLNGLMPLSIAVAADGSVWWIDNSNPFSDNVLHRRTLAGVVTTFNVVNGRSEARRLIAGPDGAVWLVFSGAGLTNGIVRIDPSTGQQTYVRFPNVNGVVNGAVPTPDGSIWYTQQNPNTVGRLDLDRKLSVVTVTSTANPGPYGNFDLKATVTSADGVGTPTGQVIFMSGNLQLGVANLVNGVAVVHNPAIDVGTFGVTADYSGDATFAGNLSAVFMQTVNQIPTTTTLEVLPSDGYSRAGDLVTLKATIHVPSGAPTPTGTVQFIVNGVPAGPDQSLNGDSAVLKTAGLPQGLDSLTAMYVGNSKNVGSTSPAVLQYVDFNAQLDRYVESVYIDLLGRLPDDAGRAYWTGLLGSGVPRAATSAALANSDEYHSDVIAGMYEFFLERDTDSSGLAYWVSQMSHGMTFERFECLLIGSDEYFQMASKGDGDNDTFVKSMYVDILGRNVDPAGEAYFVSLLQSGTSRPQVVSAIVYSAENLSTTVDSYYQLFLGRTSDPAGNAYWVSQLQRGARDETIIALIIGSDEYYSLVG